MIWAALVLAMVGGGVWKLILISRRASEIDSGSGLAELMGSFFGVNSIHVTGAMIVAIAASVAFSVWLGHPWYAVPATGVIMGIWMNAIGSETRVGEYLVSGWWSILVGAAALFFVEAAPFLWFFAVFGGMFLSFAAATALALRRGRGAGRP